MPNFTLHTTKKTWSEAESECQKEGGHLASVTSEEVNQVVAEVAGGNGVWLGGRGRKKGGELTWSDKSTWGYTNFEDTPSDGDCVRSYNGEWNVRSCTWEFLYFVCQKNNILKRKFKTSHTGNFGGNTNVSAR